jgi:hypothetical protein
LCFLSFGGKRNEWQTNEKRKHRDKHRDKHNDRQTSGMTCFEATKDIETMDDISRNLKLKKKKKKKKNFKLNRLGSFNCNYVAYVKHIFWVDRNEKELDRKG